MQYIVIHVSLIPGSLPSAASQCCTRGRTRSVSAAPALEASARVRGAGLRRSGSGEPQQTRGSINGAIPIAG